MLDFHRFRCLTFDCYGTMIDWESGILDAMRPILAAHGKSKSLTDSEILALYGELESRGEQAPYRIYREVLRDVVRGFGERVGFTATDQEKDSLPNSLGDWKPFPDTIAALRRLKSKFKLAVISNVDDDLFERTAQHLEVPFDHVITAQQARSYKPSHNNFELALRVIGLPREQVLHVAQSLFHDHVPAKAMGFTTVWVNRRRRVQSAGATPPADAHPDLEVPDLKWLADLAAP
jgi:2-haloacid dehalogenase